MTMQSATHMKVNPYDGLPWTGDEWYSANPHGSGFETNVQEGLMRLAEWRRNGGQITKPRSWYDNYPDDVLREMVAANPSLAFDIDDESKKRLGLPQFAGQTVNGQSVAQPWGGVQAPNTPPPGIRYIGSAPGKVGPEPTIAPPDTRSAAAGDRTGTITRGGATGAQLTENGVSVPLPPGVAAPITGQRMPTYRTQGNVPIFSSQALARMTPGEREVLGTTVNRAGGRAEDYFDQQRKQFSAPTSSGASYRARRY